jgi:ribosome-binding ATPase
VKVGIVGLPNAGKSTLFNALTRAGAQTGEYPFTTVEPNIALAAVPDERLVKLAETLASSELVPESIEFDDIAGLVRGASEGEGLGNQFLAAIRETDAICHVVRCHADSRVPHPDGKVDPVADAETVETELLLADLEQAERRLERVTKQARSGAPEAIAERDWLAAVRDALAAGRPARSVAVPEAAAEGPRKLAALTSKPVLYVANVGEEQIVVPEELAAHAATAGASAVAVSARLEGELTELEGQDVEEMRTQLGVSESGLDAIVRAAYELLELITFFTADRAKEATARSLRRGSTALQAAGKVHTDFERDFIKAEVIGWDRLVEAGGYVEAQGRGLLRVEGRDYLVQDGDVINIKT